MKRLVHWFCRIYRAMLWAYPASFRRRYGGEMSQVFADRCWESARSRALGRFLLGSALDWSRSVIRERFAATSPSAGFATAPCRSADGVPVFYLGASETPARAALVEGTVLTFVVFAALAFALTHWGNHRIAFVIGAHGAFSSNLQVDYKSTIETDRKTEVRVAPEPADAWRKFVSSYFTENLVLLVLDRNRDLVISADEIAKAPARLRMLDVNHDGKLDAEECGLILFREPQPGAEWPKQAARDYMRFHPVLAALDTNHDGEISADEIRNSSAALRKLVKNKEGSLTADELLPYRR
jgi:Ca2+-binding EF-hand superfamily protein